MAEGELPAIEFADLGAQHSCEAPVLVLAVAAFFVFGTTGASELRCQSDYYSEGTYQKAQIGDGHQLPRFDRAWLPCLVERAIAGPQASETTEKDQRDLIAQETTALWGFWVAAFAGFTALVTSVGTFLIWRQVSLTREAVEDTGKATKAMNKANDLAERAFFVQNRGWVGFSIEHLTISINITETICSAGMHVELTNSGGSVATDINLVLKPIRAGTLHLEIDKFIKDGPQTRIYSRTGLMPGGKEPKWVGSGFRLEDFCGETGIAHFHLIVGAFYETIGGVGYTIKAISPDIAMIRLDSEKTAMEDITFEQFAVHMW